MIVFERGGNTRVTTGPVEVLVEWAPEKVGGCDVDASAFLLLANGKVVSEAAFVFYGNPSSPEGAVRLEPGRGASRFRVDLGRVPPSVERVAFAVTIHGRQSFASMSRLKLTLPGVATFVCPTAGMPEAAVILGELYRLSGGWKFRAVAQGWSGGLAPLATHFGVEVSDDGAPPPQVAAPTTPQRPSGPIRLEKRQTISLDKSAGRALTRVTFGLGWDSAAAGESVDLDASCVLLDGQRNAIESVYFGHLASADGSVQHTGDNLTGDGDGDDEQIRVDLGRVPARVVTLMFTINSYRGHKFSDIRNAFCRVVDEATGRELARYNLSQGTRSTAMLMAKVQRRSDGWHMTALGEAAEGRTVREILAAVCLHA